MEFVEGQMDSDHMSTGEKSDNSENDIDDVDDSDSSVNSGDSYQESIEEERSENLDDTIEEKATVIYKLTEEQKNAIKELFDENEWDYKEIDWDEEAEHQSSFDPHDVTPGFVIKDSTEESDVECPHCFCTPCITDEKRRQAWWPTQPCQPHEANTLDRKKCYKSFWTMMWHREAFKDARYLQRPSEGMERDANTYITEETSC